MKNDEKKICFASEAQEAEGQAALCGDSCSGAGTECGGDVASGTGCECGESCRENSGEQSGYASGARLDSEDRGDSETCDPAIGGDQCREEEIVSGPETGYNEYGDFATFIESGGEPSSASGRKIDAGLSEQAARLEMEESELQRLVGEIASGSRLFTAAEMKAYAEHRCRIGMEGMMREQFLRDLDDVKKIDMAELYSHPENEPRFGRGSVWR